MWFGGVRVIVLDDSNRVLMIRQDHKERSVWMIPGGGIEEGENAYEAAIREVKEETGVDIEVKRMLWHIEEVGERGQRFVNVFMAKALNSDIIVGKDPEFADDQQVISKVQFMSKEEILSLDAVYPKQMKDKFWERLDGDRLEYDSFMIREDIIKEDMSIKQG